MSEDIVARLKATAGPEIDGFFGCCVQRAQVLAESPIETLLAAALLFIMKGAEVRRGGASNWCFGSVDKEKISIVQQHQWGAYRIDIAIFIRGRPEAFIECDGHEFHERTKEQAERDRSRDREIQSAGILALRFTGREIWRDPFVCVGEIFQALDALGRDP